MARANDVEYGLTAGFFSEDPDEIQWWLAWLPILRRLERQRLHRQSGRQLLLHSAVHARAKPNRRRLTKGKRQWTEGRRQKNLLPFL